MKKRYKIIIAVFLIIVVAGSVLWAVIPPLINVYNPMRLATAYQTPDASRTGKSGVTVTNGAVKATFGLDSGRFDIGYGGVTLTKGAFFTAVVNGKTLNGANQTGYKWRTENLSDEFGDGVSIIVSNVYDGIAESFFFNVYENKPYIVSGAEYTSEDGATVLYTNNMRQVYAGDGASTQIGNMRDVNFLLAPYDNDKYVKYIEQEAAGGYFKSYEYSMLYNTWSRESIVFGSVDHDAFKSAAEIDMSKKIYDEMGINSLAFRHGVADYGTRDFKNGAEHGYINGVTVASPRVFYGYYDDYRSGLEAFGEANAAVQPMLEWNNPVPVGYNSWAGYGMNVSYDAVTGVSDYLKDNISGFTDHGTVYVNLDSGWGNFTNEQISTLPAYLNANGQKAGIYLTPFSAWGMGAPGALDRPIYEGANYTWREIVLKDKDGAFVSTHEKYDDKTTLSLDLTHPGTYELMEHNLKRFFDWGYEFIKIDFIIHGATEGDFYDKTKATTGIMAYNYGMQRLLDFVNDKDFTHGKDIFLSAAISPLFPSGYMHSRRISCDVFENYGAAHYRLNSHTYAWWQNGTLYKFNDPDHIVLTHDWENIKISSSAVEADMVVNSALISGTLLMWSDNISRDLARTRAEKYFNNKELLAVALRNEAFRPTWGGYASEIYYSLDDEYLYLAVFNLDLYSGETFELNLSEYGFNANQYEYLNLNTGKGGKSSGKFTLKLKIKGSAIIRFKKVG
ncbi:MAG: hypothetical protein LBT55_04575 [Clostridiaceae bacterium]|nr:hypothetical protein [Clostridiaceae bacterium]